MAISVFDFAAAGSAARGKARKQRLCIPDIVMAVLREF
jgi:hypothetical protein